MRPTKLPPLGPWICDSCGGAITDPNWGWVEWLNPSEGKYHGMRLVHHNSQGPSNHGCQRDEQAEWRMSKSSIPSLDQAHLMGADGLIILLEMASNGQFEMPSDIIEMIKRLHVPGYEQARRHFSAAISDGVFEPNTRGDFYPMVDIIATIKWANESSGD